MFLGKILGNVIINVPDDATNLNEKGSCFLARISKDGRYPIYKQIKVIRTQ